jgi:hypothetical protein
MGIKQWHKTTLPTGIKMPYLQKAFISATLANVGKNAAF